MLKKTPVKKTNKTSVIFAIDGFEDASKIELAGDFNDWNPESTPLKKRKDGKWAVALRLPREERFQYKFVVDDRKWIADEEADALVPDSFGGVNSVCDLSANGSR